MNEKDIREALKAFICNDLIRNPDYVLADDEPLITGGLIDSFSLAEIGVFLEETFAVHIPDSDLTVERMDTLNQMVERVMQEM